MNRQDARNAEAIRQCTPMAANGFSIESNESMDSNDSIRSIRPTLSIHSTTIAIVTSQPRLSSSVVDCRRA
jgi:hypothetical protein